MPFKKGDVGNPKGRPSQGREKDMFALLDKVGIPLAIRHNIAVLNGTHPSIKNMKDGPGKVRLQTDSSKILMSKAPERMEGLGDGTPLNLRFIAFGTIQGEVSDQQINANSAPELSPSGSVVINTQDYVAKKEDVGSQSFAEEIPEGVEQEA